MSRATEAEAEMEDEPRPVPGGKAVLVVEEDRQFSDLVSFYLRQSGYTPIQLYAGAGVFERARTLAPAFITLDIALSDGDGWDVLRVLKSDPETRDIPVLAISMAEDGELALSLGAVDYLVKPVKRDDLEALLDRLTSPGALSRRFTVLAVDDDPEMIQLLREMLPVSKFTLYATCDGEQAVGLARGQDPDVILLDLMMPGMSGLEVLEALRNDVRTAGIPIIVLTAKDVTPQERRVLDESVHGLMRKNTLTPQSILAELHRLETLQRRESR